MHSPAADHRAFRVDAHHHLWRYTSEEFGWIDDSMAALRRDFLVEDLAAVLREAAVDGAVAVQARQSVEETEWLLSLARRTPAMLGVVGWLPLASPDLPRFLDRFAKDPLMKGVRHVVQGEPDGFLDRPAFNEGIAMLPTAGLVYDVLILERQLEEAIRFVDRHPSQAFVLDHLAKPKIASGEMEPWRRHIGELARRPHVTCKVSGMITEANPQDWSEVQLQPYFDLVLEAFGPSRLMVGSDWPVLTVGCGYPQWWRLVERWVASLSQDERADILGQTAMRVYGLQPLMAGQTAGPEGDA